MGHETANSFLNFSVGSGRLLPTGGKVEDLTHFMGNGRITITERVVDVVPGAIADAVPEKDDFPRGENVPEEVKEAASGKLPYFVDAYPDRIEIFMAERRVAALSARKSFDLAELEAAMFPFGESDRVIDITATLVETAIDR